MRGALALTLVVSLGAHVAAFASLVHSRAPSAEDGRSDPPPRLAGETFELPAPETAEVQASNGSPSPSPTGAPPAAPAAEDGDAPARPSPPAHGRANARPSRSGRPSTGPAHAEASAGSTGSAALYGAVGERSASDLATAFTRGFPQAASADPAWRAASLGNAGETDVVFTLNEAGHIESTQVLGSPSPALANGIRRTLALIRGRPFVARGKVTKLHLTATVSSDSVHDGLHGDVFAVGGSFDSGEGSAFFALAIGRRIDVRVRLR